MYDTILGKLEREVTTTAGGCARPEAVTVLANRSGSRFSVLGARPDKATNEWVDFFRGFL